jgi:hypothetical protein
MRYQSAPVAPEERQETTRERAERQHRERQEELRYTASDGKRWKENRERVLRERERVKLPPIEEVPENPELDSVSFDDFYYSVAPSFAHNSIIEKGLIPATEELVLKGATCGNNDLSKRSLANKRLLYQASCSGRAFQRELFDSNVIKLKEAVKKLSSSNLSMKEITDNIKYESRYLPKFREEVAKNFINGIPDNNFITTTLLGAQKVNRTISNQTTIDKCLSLDNDIELKDILCFSAYEAASKEAFENCLGKLYLTTSIDNIAKYTGYKCNPKKEDDYAYLYRVPKSLVIVAGEDTQEAGAVFTTTVIPPSNLEFMKTKPNRVYKKEDFKNEQFEPLKINL